MQVLEKTIPWWRKALKFALGGIRSGFGFFPRPARLAPVAVPMFSGGYKENPEEERALTKVFPKLETVVAAPAIPAEAGPKPGAIASYISEPEEAKEEIGTTRELPEETSGAKARVDSVGVMRGLKPPPPSESGFSVPSEAGVAREAEVEPEPETAPLLSTESQTVTEAEPIAVPAADGASDDDFKVPPVEVVNAETVNEAAPEPVEEAESEEEAEPVDEPETEKSANVEVVPETAPETVEEGVEPAAEPESNDAPEVVDVTPSEPFKEPELEEITEAETVKEFAPEPVEAAEPTMEVRPEPATEPERAPELVVEQTPTADAGAQLVLTAESSAEEKADSKAEEKAAAKLAARQKKLDESSEQSPFSVFVGQVYDGPLDLLLDLIRKQDIDIYDIPIARITAQFLAYVNQLKAGDVDVAGEFIYTASLLIHIKSKMLLPRAPSGPEDVAEDPRRELVERLLEHERFKNAAQMLQQKQMLEAATWSNPGVREFKDDEGAEPEIAADTVDLVRIFRDILERAHNRPVLDVEEDSVTVGQMIQFLARRLTMEDKPVALRRLLSHTRSERALIAMFLALLEMVRLQAILLRQDRQFSEIFIKKHSGFDAVMNEGLGNARDDWR
jgi:segregation and condensation protein A